ncbi:RNA polymerase sigma-70 factor (ECF subfamily) [Dysgonomonas sp. PFB1-18]|uniref:RNA polymerase sigma-70 factor n=1 Tax=unclassified Dysgonomonas TaxID=2630389 RepID=UPI0024745B4F|nr:MULTISPECIES: RNA polymerase sigma-70 factor [unclassified Dysgonomonas]MDH6311194.1 RNA polymerase sigma-70 factor (ECF subfamily) [Dysgonomonas sp. PF1-14]MDH6341072.1 RNA polymerase sigma-70 factor (ECF subfamily) [Dysgonomonas sp. PF1-16]MDH6382775.1 RNA polymerase sigma-70 factor (ECF subfamily) [Dysgonomonas sp. PFB1-18]MDH6400066.1 RNA polymerase sigma-70 factor (ECF subfamily) [Dysgonomonas sp. PF1-23]
MKELSDLKIFNELYTSCHSRFARFANSYIRDLPASEDIVIESFMAYWENRDRLSENSNIQAYILTTIKNKCLSYLQHLELKARVLNNIEDNAQWELNLRISTLEACDPKELFSAEIQQIINESLASLPERTSEVFNLSRYKNKSHKEIAEVLNITTKGVEFHITKALAQLRKDLKDYILYIIVLFFL